MSRIDIPEIKFDEENFRKKIMDENGDVKFFSDDEFMKFDENEKNTLIKEYASIVYSFVMENNHKGNIFSCNVLSKFNGKQLYNMYKQGVFVYDIHLEKIYQYIIENNLKGGLFDHKKQSLFKSDQLHNLFLNGVFVDEKLRTWENIT